MLNELRNLAQSDKISLEASLRLLLSSQADLIARVDLMTGERLEMKNAIRDLNDSFDDAEKETKIFRAAMLEAIKKINTNPAIQVGTFITQHPKATIAIVIIVFIIMNLWFVSGIREIVMVNLGFPPEIIKVLVP